MIFSLTARLSPPASICQPLLSVVFVDSKQQSLIFSVAVAASHLPHRVVAAIRLCRFWPSSKPVHHSPPPKFAQLLLLTFSSRKIDQQFAQLLSVQPPSPSLRSPAQEQPSRSVLLSLSWSVDSD
ncbi:hypothetical protein SAY86_018208 [Trapa natans]|uniref:Uncharacterized protein n=1 Tax=Trapa natans TaxID=22666 RepID=A0AAN7LEP6_TRANT|nr:hypothetical protein SAY86_018208 [Trapa natans]